MKNRKELRILPHHPNHTLKKELAMPAKKGFFLANYTVNQKPQKLDSLRGKISPDIDLPKEWLEDDWAGIEFLITVPEEDSETMAGDIESQTKDGLKRRQQEFIRHLLGKGPHERSEDDLALMEKIAEEGKISISLHHLANWQTWRGIAKKPVSPEESAKKAIAGFKKKGLDDAQILALVEEALSA